MGSFVNFTRVNTKHDPVALLMDSFVDFLRKLKFWAFFVQSIDCVIPGATLPSNKICQEKDLL